MSRRTQKNVGVIGLGIIGSRVGEVLRRKGFHVFVWNRTPRPVPNFVGAPVELAEMCDFLQIFVSDDDALLQIVKQLSPGLAPRHIVLAHSTVAPQTMTAAAEIVERRGARFVEAPFTGSKEAAEKGELVYYLGGDEAAIREARPVLEASGKQVLEIGAIGQATAIKLATNMVTAASIQSAAEALAVVQSAGIPLQKFAAAMQGNASNSTTLSMKLAKMIEGDFEPHFSVKHMLKDMQIANRLGLAHHLELGVSSAARDRLLEQMQRGHGDDDYSVVVRKYFPDVPVAGSEANGLELFESRAPAASPAPAPAPETPVVSESSDLVSSAAPETPVVSESSDPVSSAAPDPCAPAEQTVAPDGFQTQLTEVPDLTPAPNPEPAGQVDGEETAGETDTMFAEETVPDEAVQPRGFLSRLLRR
jgi:3-hydroxyisobutyrate dehydrogenase-like beta-hydroxyacid dehydrogenase